MARVPKGLLSRRRSAALVRPRLLLLVFFNEGRIATLSRIFSVALEFFCTRASTVTYDRWGCVDFIFGSHATYCFNALRRRADNRRVKSEFNHPRSSCYEFLFISSMYLQNFLTCTSLYLQNLLILMLLCRPSIPIPIKDTN